MRKSKAFSAFLKQKKISQSEAARRLGVPRMTFWRWINEKTDPSPLARAAIKAKLGFDW